VKVRREGRANGILIDFLQIGKGIIIQKTDARAQVRRCTMRAITDAKQKDPKRSGSQGCSNSTPWTMGGGGKKSLPNRQEEGEHKNLSRNFIQLKARVHKKVGGAHDLNDYEKNCTRREKRRKWFIRFMGKIENKTLQNKILGGGPGDRLTTRSWQTPTGVTNGAQEFLNGDKGIVHREIVCRTIKALVP